MKLTGCVDNIIDVYKRSDQLEKAEGLTAFNKYNKVMQTIALKYSLPIKTVTAVFVALSPSSSYINNLRSTVSVIEGFFAGKSPTSITISTYGHCKNRAYTYLQGIDFTTTVKGKKIKNFYVNITEPMHPSAVTIDGHAVCCWTGVRTNLKVVATSNFNYDTIANAFRQAAKEVNILPCQMQSTTWFAWKRINDVLYSPMLSLFSKENDLLGIEVDLDCIKPF